MEMNYGACGLTYNTMKIFICTILYSLQNDLTFDTCNKHFKILNRYCVFNQY